MKSDIWALKGELAVLKKELEELNILASNCIMTIRENLNPLNIEEDFTDLDIKSARMEMKQLDENLQKATAKKSLITRIEKQLKEIERAMQ